MNAIRALAIVGCLPGIGFSQEDAGTPPTTSSSVKIFRLSHAPATDVAEALARVLKEDKGAWAVPYPISNDLVFVHASEERMRGIAELVMMLDQKPAQIEIDVTILQTAAGAAADAETAELSGDVEAVKAKLAALEKSGTVQVHERLHLTTTDNQRSQLQVGKNEPVTRGRTFGGGATREGFGRPSQAIVSMESVGTMVTVVPRVAAGDVIMELAVEKFWIPMVEPKSDEDNSSNATETRRLSVVSTLTVPKGQAVFFGGQTFKDQSEQLRFAVIVMAHIKD